MVSSTVGVITLCSSESAFYSLIPGLCQLSEFPMKPTCSCTGAFVFQRKKYGFGPLVAK